MDNKRFHITIKDNEKDELLLDIDAVAIVGGVSDGDNGSYQLGFTSCNAINIGIAISECDEARNKLVKANPEILLAQTLFGAFKIIKETEGDSNNE